MLGIYCALEPFFRHQKTVFRASHTLTEKSRENAELLRRIGDLEADVGKLRQQYDSERHHWTQENSRLDGELQMLRNRGQKAQADLDKMKRLREEMLQLAQGYQ